MAMPNQATTSTSDLILIAEGAEGACPIEYGYVRQGDKVLVTLGDQAHVQARLGESIELVESIDDLETELTESLDEAGKTTQVAKVKNGVWVVEGVFQRSDTLNANKRTYSRGLWERVLKEDGPIMEKINERGMIGVVEHPGDGRTKLLESALVVTKNELQKDGTVWGEAELLDTPGGLVLQELTRKGVKWGVSSRGNGTVNAKGEVDPATFVLETYDAVARPSTPGAFPKPKVNEEDQLDENKFKEIDAKGKKLGDKDGQSWFEYEGNIWMLKGGKAINHGPIAKAKSKLNKGILKAIGLAEEEIEEANEPTLMDRIEELNAAEMVQFAGQFNDHLKAATPKPGDELTKIIDTLDETLAGLDEDGIIKESYYEDVAKAEAESRIVTKLVGIIAERNQTVTNLQEQIESMSESETSLTGNTEIEEELADVNARLEETQNRLDTVSTKLFEANRKLQQATVEQEAMTSRLQQAQQYVAEAEVNEDTVLTDPVTEAANAAIEKHPKLKGHRDELLESVSVAELDALVEKLTKPQTSMLLPTTAIKSDPVKKTPVTESRELPSGVARAAAAVQSMG